MLTKLTKMIGLGLVSLVVAVALALTNTPALAQPQPPPHNQPTLAAAPAAAPITFNLCASAGNVTMPDGVIIPFWGFSALDTFGVCGPAQLPGPELRVNQGDVVTVNLTNNLSSVPTSIIFTGQTGVTTLGGSAGTFTAEAAAGGGTVSYTFTAGAPGTYLYESGTADQPQVSMGLYGALIVYPTGFPFPLGGQAYSDASTAYDVEQVLVLSEIDPALNADVFANPTTYTFDLLDYNPTYWLLNGRAYGPGTGDPDVLDPDNPGTSQPYSAAIAMDLSLGQNRLLVRYVNAGGTHHTMSLLGMHQRVIAKDADELDFGPPTQQYDATAETIPSGQTTDVIIAPPAGGSFPLYNRQLHITNGDPGPRHFVPGGGMMTFLTVTGTAAPPANNPPVAGPDGPYSVNQGATLSVAAPGVLGNDNDGGDGPGPLTAILDTGPANATSFTLNPDGSFTYTHNGTATTSDSFTYHANDGAADSSIVTVSITIIPNVPPVANNNAYSVNQGATLNEVAPGVMSNDSDPDSSPNPITAILVTGPSHASSFTLNANGSFNYVHNNDLALSDSFTYKVNDGLADSNVATVNITINPSPNKHVADLDYTAVNPPSATWNATVTITVHNTNHTTPIFGALVSTSWSTGGTGGTLCFTGLSGTCSVTRSGIPDAQLTKPFTVTNVTIGLPFLTYVQGRNHDPDSGAQASNGTNISVPKPP